MDLQPYTTNVPPMNGERDMDFANIARRRMDNQGLVNPTADNPVDVVAWQGAVQSQEYAFAKWAVAQRTTGMNDAEMEQAFTDGTILRTHVMRPTWHFVTPADIRWMLALPCIGRRHSPPQQRRARQGIGRGQAPHPRRTGNGAPASRYCYRWLTTWLPGRACRTGRAHLQRPAARQAVYLRAARRASAARKNARA
jgi:hypothetical protein